MKCKLDEFKEWSHEDQKAYFKKISNKLKITGDPFLLDEFFFSFHNSFYRTSDKYLRDNHKNTVHRINEVKGLDDYIGRDKSDFVIFIPVEFFLDSVVFEKAPSNDLPKILSLILNKEIKSANDLTKEDVKKINSHYQNLSKGIDIFKEINDNNDNNSLIDILFNSVCSVIDSHNECGEVIQIGLNKTDKSLSKKKVMDNTKFYSKNDLGTLLEDAPGAIESDYYIILKSIYKEDVVNRSLIPVNTKHNGLELSFNILDNKKSSFDDETFGKCFIFEKHFNTKLQIFYYYPEDHRAMRVFNEDSNIGHTTLCRSPEQIMLKHSLEYLFEKHGPQYILNIFDNPLYMALLSLGIKFSDRSYIGSIDKVADLEVELKEHINRIFNYNNMIDYNDRSSFYSSDKINSPNKILYLLNDLLRYSPKFGKYYHGLQLKNDRKVDNGLYQYITDLESGKADKNFKRYLDLLVMDDSETKTDLNVCFNLLCYIGINEIIKDNSDRLEKLNKCMEHIITESDFETFFNDRVASLSKDIELLIDIMIKEKYFLPTSDLHGLNTRLFFITAKCSRFRQTISDSLSIFRYHDRLYIQKFNTHISTFTNGDNIFPFRKLNKGVTKEYLDKITREYYFKKYDPFEE